MEFLSTAVELAKNGPSGVYSLFLLVIGGFVYVLWRIVTESNRTQSKYVEALEKQMTESLTQMREITEKINEQNREFRISLFAVIDSSNKIIQENTTAINGFRETLHQFLFTQK